MSSTITLTHPTAGAGGTPLALDLPPDLIWTDELAWARSEMATERSIDGALIVDYQQRTEDGRPMTLSGGPDHAWCTRATLITLRAWADVPMLQLTLARNGTTYTVVFDSERGAVEVEPVVNYADPLPGDLHQITLRLLIRA